jgi:hypothetical protein
MIRVISFLFLVLSFGCDKTSQSSVDSKSSNNPPTMAVTMQTDSIQYVRISGSISIQILVHNATDSTVVFPSCHNILYRVDTSRNNIWLEGTSNWNGPCTADTYPFTFILSDSTIYRRITIRSSGTYRIASIYGSSIYYFPDMVFSNRFTIL